MSSIPFFRSLRFRLLLAALAIELLALAGMLISGLSRMESELGQQLNQHVAALERAYQTAIAVPLISRDYATLRDILDGWRDGSDLQYIAVSDSRDRILAASGIGTEQPLPQPQARVAWGEILHVRFPVTYSGQTYGSVQLGLSTEFIAAARSRLVWQGGSVALAGALLTALLLFVTSLWLTRHLRTLADAASRVAEGDYNVHVNLSTQDEVGLLAHSFNTMASAVEARVEELAHQAGHDPLTGLHNRRAFESYLDEALRLCRNQALYVLYLDLDQFKAVNDSCGHAAGDRLLQNLAGLMTERFGADFLARLGGDEFGLIILNKTLEQARQSAQQMADEIRAMPFVWDGKAFQLGASIGLVQASPQLDTVAGLLIAADTACYAAKERGRNRVEVYAPGDDYFRQRQQELSSLTGITAALQQDRFVLYHQRIVSLDGRSPDHAEILIRMHDADGRLVSAGEFIPAAERYNLMPLVDRWVIEHALARIRARLDAGNLPFDHLNINLSGGSLAVEELRHFIAARIAEYRIDPRLLCFEITESQAIGNLAGAQALIADVRRMGATMALDDFGSGLSSFAYLKRFEVDYLKIDGQFVRNLLHDSIDRATVEAIVGLARAHQLKTVAEFVTQPELLPILRELGVGYAQGYALHQPEPF